MIDPTTPMPPEQPAVPPQIPQAPSADAPQVLSSTAPTELGAPGVVQPDQAPKRKRYKVPLISAAAAIAILLISVGVVAAQAESPFAAAKQKCGATSTDYAQLGDGGKTLTLRSIGKESDGLSFEQLECYWSELKVPDSVRAEIGATRALDGRQTGNWGNIHASWSYHPDSGLQMVLTLSD